MSNFPTSPRPKRATVGARVILSVIGLALAAAGVLFTWALWRAYERASETHRWTETPCIITRSVVEEQREILNEPVRYVPGITYTYLVDTESYESTNVRRVAGQTFKERAGAQEIVTKYPQGQGAFCYVNPDDPKAAILLRETRAPLYSIWFPLLFVVGGLGMVINVWWPKGPDEIEESAVAANE